MRYVIQRGMLWVTWQRIGGSYSNNPNDARIYESLEEAKNNLCPDSGERIVPLDDKDKPQVYANRI